MADRLTKQPLTITSVNVHELNDVLRRIQVELDRLSGLSGTIKLYDTIHIYDDNGQILHGSGAQP